MAPLAAVALAALLPGTALPAPGNPPLRLAFLPLDSGDATLVQAPGQNTLLAGGGSGADGSAVLKALRSRGIRSLDTLIVGSWRSNHVGGMSAILKGLPVRQFFHNALFLPTQENREVYRLAAAPSPPGRKVFAPMPGEEITLFYNPPLRVRAVSPTGPMLTSYKDDPSCSMVLEWSYDRLSFLDLGETTRRHQDAFWATTPSRPTGEILAIGRSGAADALNPGLLKPMRTRVAVLRVPRKGGKKPAPELLAALRRGGVRVFRTDLHGTVTVSTDGRTIEARAERGAAAVKIPVR